jgi:hypothetical protein
MLCAMYFVIPNNPFHQLQPTVSNDERNVDFPRYVRIQNRQHIKTTESWSYHSPMRRVKSAQAEWRDF